MKLFKKKNKLFPPIEPYDTGFLKRENMKYIMNSAATQKVSQLYFFMVVQVEAVVRFLEGFLIQKNIELFYLIKGGAEGANHIPV
jgi:hypothetical protein